MLGVLCLQIHKYWTTYLQSLQSSLTNEYYYYKTGEIPFAKLETVLTKLNDYYRLTDSPSERFTRFNAGFSVVVIHLLATETGVKFTLMCRANDAKNGLFFEREKYADARVKRNRIHLNNCYELLRVNKVGYSFSGKDVEGKNGVWTVGLTGEELTRIYTEFNQALLKRNYLVVKQICHGVGHLIGFAEVRRVYPELKLKLEKRFTQLHKSQQGSRYKILSDVYKLPTKLSYIRKSSGGIVPLGEILEGAK